MTKIIEGIIQKLLTSSFQRQQRGNILFFFLNLNVNYPKPIGGETPL